MNKRLSLGPKIDSLLDRLYERHSSQNEELGAYFAARAREDSFDWNNFDDRTNQFLSDKLIALDRDKAEFCYHVCRALNAKRIVEAGTSFGVSTLYLACAVRDNVHGAIGQGVVIGTEYESKKAEAARANFAEAGLTDFIDLREGDLRKTLADPGGIVDFMLLDIWTPLVRPAVELIAPYLRTGSVIVCDNTAQFRDSYQDYFDFVGDLKNGLSTTTLPFEGGLEFTVRIS
jgi:predicted O-methyltransferase YrrM